MERTSVTSLISAVALWLAMVSPVLSDETFKVAVMNQQVVIELSKAGKRALEELKAYSMTRQKIINAEAEVCHWVAPDGTRHPCTDDENAEVQRELLIMRTTNDKRRQQRSEER